MTDFPTLLYSSTSEIPTLSFVYLKPENVLLSGCTFPCCRYREYPPPPPGDMGRCHEPLLIGYLLWKGIRKFQVKETKEASALDRKIPTDYPLIETTSSRGKKWSKRTIIKRKHNPVSCSFKHFIVLVLYTDL